VQRHWLIERKLHRTFGAFVAGEFLLEGASSGRGWIKADVVFEGGKINDRPLQHESRNSVADGVLRFRGRLSNRVPDLFQDALNLGREARDVIVDSGRLM